MSASRQVIALKLGAGTDDAEPWHALVREARRLAGAEPLHLATLDTTDDTDPPPPPAGATVWWRFRHAEIDAAEASLADEVLLQLGCMMLQQEGLGTAAPRLVLLPAGAEALAARLAARFGGVALGRCLSIETAADGVRAVRASHGGRLRLAVHSRARCCFATWRGDTVIDQSPPSPPHERRVTLTAPLPTARPREMLPSADAQTPLAGARLVVSGGRGMQGEEGFLLLARLAQKLGGAVGGSLPAVDAGWLPVARQIGQSGRFVAPRIYLAVGISGTLQHLAGVSPSSTIIAINRDPEAPIFGVAEIGVVADWRELLPRLIARLDPPAGSPA